MLPPSASDTGYALESDAYQAAQTQIENEINRGRGDEELVFLFG